MTQGNDMVKGENQDNGKCENLPAVQTINVTTAQLVNLQQRLGNPLLGHGKQILLVSNKRTESRDDALTLLTFKNQQSAKGSTLIGQTLAVKGFVLHTAETERDGELVELVRTVLILDDNSTVEFFGKGVVKSLEELMALDAQDGGYWEPPLKLTVATVPTKLGQTHKLVMAQDKKAAKK